MKDSLMISSKQKDLHNVQTDHGTSPPLLFWIDTKVESVANKREHHMASHRRRAAQRKAVQAAVANLPPPRVPDESEDTP